MLEDDKDLTMVGGSKDTTAGQPRYIQSMLHHGLRIRSPHLARATRLLLLILVLFGTLPFGNAQNTPLLSGGVGFFNNTNNGATGYLPIIAPLIAAPIGGHVLVESRAAILENFAPKTGGQNGYNHTHFVGLTYLSGDYFASPHATIIGGSFFIPFGTYNERLSPIWISNFQDGPLIQGIGVMSTGVGVGGQLRGSLFSAPKISVDYAAYFSARSEHQQFKSKRSSGGRLNIYLPEKRLEMGVSYGRLLQGTHENFYGAHLWWEPRDSALRLRSEWARGQHAHGYWVAIDYRPTAFGGLDSPIGRLEPLLRFQQTFRIDNIASDSVPSVNTQRVDAGLNYNLPHNTRILTSYSRQFASTGDHNIWETGIVYRFLFPAWKGK